MAGATCRLVSSAECLSVHMSKLLKFHKKYIYSEATEFDFTIVVSPTVVCSPFK